MKQQEQVVLVSFVLRVPVSQFALDTRIARPHGES